MRPRRILAIAVETLFSQSQMAFGNGKIARVFRDLIPEVLQVADLIGLRQVVKAWRSRKKCFRHLVFRT